MFFRRYPEFGVWAKQRGIFIQPANFKKRVKDFARDFNNNELGGYTEARKINTDTWPLAGGGKKKRKTRKHKKRNKKTKKRKRKNYRKNKKSNKHKKKKNKKSKKRNKKR